MDGRTFKIEFEVDDVELKLMHSYKIGNELEGIGCNFDFLEIN